jgi:choline monooxygenase
MISISEDIRYAKTLPALFYRSQRAFDFLKENVFAQSLQFVGSLSEIDSTLTPFEVLPEFVSEPLLIVKQDDAYQAFSNVCTHRANLLITKPCNADLIRCNYHGRRFDLSGRVLSMPEFEGCRDFPSESDNLSQVVCKSIFGFLFAGLEDKFDIAEIEKKLTGVELIFKATQINASESKTFKVKANWVIYCDNYLEGFHIPFVHNKLNTVIDFPSYRTTLLENAVLQTAFERTGEVAAQYLFIFPNTMLNFYPWGISVNIVKPIDLENTEIEFRYYVKNHDLRAGGAGGELETVEHEDEQVVEQVSKGLKSRLYKHGRYSPKMESGVHHFHRLIAGELNSAGIL